MRRRTREGNGASVNLPGERISGRHRPGPHRRCADLILLILAWGPCPGRPADVSGDGVVDFQDVLMLLAAWGPCDG